MFFFLLTGQFSVGEHTEQDIIEVRDKIFVVCPSMNHFKRSTKVLLFYVVQSVTVRKSHNAHVKGYKQNGLGVLLFEHILRIRIIK